MSSLLKGKLSLVLGCLCTAPLAVSSTVSFSNHTQDCYYCSPNSYYHADLNNDSHEDMAYIVSPSTMVYGAFAVMFSNGNGAFAFPVTYILPNYSRGSDTIGELALGDFNHDGSIDILAFGVNSGNAYLYLNNGKGVFTLSGTFPFAANGSVDSVSATVGDFNRDNNSDVAFIHNGLLNIWLGNGKGGFTPALSESVNGTRLTMGDFDGDGLADLLIYQDVAAISTAYVYYGDGTGHFPNTVTLSLSSGYAAFSAGDVNSDGKMDVLAADPSVAASRVFVFYGDATRKFASRTNIKIGRCTGAYPVQVADLDSNGLNDIIVEEVDCSNPNQTGPMFIDVLTRNPNASYNPDQTIYWAQPGTDGVPHEIDQPPLIINVNGDSRPDLLVQQCVDSYCTGHFDTTLLNTTPGLAPTCNMPATGEGITICLPNTGATVSSPVNFLIAATGPVLMRDAEVWVDGVKRSEQIDGFSYYTFLSSAVILNPGLHHIDVYADGWDQSTVHKTFAITIQ
jgi:hypothetical protein